MRDKNFPNNVTFSSSSKACGCDGSWDGCDSGDWNNGGGCVRDGGDDGGWDGCGSGDS